MFAETLTMLPYISFSYTDYVWLEIMLISSSDCKNASILPWNFAFCCNATFVTSWPWWSYCKNISLGLNNAEPVEGCMREKFWKHYLLERKCLWCRRTLSRSSHDIGLVFHMLTSAAFALGGPPIVWIRDTTTVLPLLPLLGACWHDCGAQCTPLISDPRRSFPDPAAAPCVGARRRLCNARLEFVPFSLRSQQSNNCCPWPPGCRIFFDEKSPGTRE